MAGERAQLISVLLAETDELERGGQRRALERSERFKVEEAEDFAAAAERSAPDLLILDPETDGSIDVDLLAELSRVAPVSRIVVFTRISAPSEALRAVAGGARAYLVKGEDTSEAFFLSTLMQVAADGRIVISPHIAERLATLPPRALEVRERRGGVPLTEREHEVLALLVDGLSDKEAAGRLSVTDHAVDQHVRHLYAKLHVRSRVQLGFAASQLGLV